MSDDELTMEQLLGGKDARVALEAYATGKTVEQVERELRRKAFEADLAARMPELLAWTRSQSAEMVKFKDANGYWSVRPAAKSEECPVCKEARLTLGELKGLEAEVKPVKPYEHTGLVVFSEDLKVAANTVGVCMGNKADFPRHDRYHVEVAYTAIKKAEYGARVARRAGAAAAKERAVIERIEKGIIDEPRRGTPRNERRKGGRFLNPYGSGHWTKTASVPVKQKKQKKQKKA